MNCTNITPDELTKDKHQTFKRGQGDVLHYVVIVNEQVAASLELNVSLCGNYWVRHSVSEVSNRGYGFALYKLVMQDIYPLGIMPSRECTSGYAVSLWEKLFKQPKIMQFPVVHPKVYCDEFDEWLEDILEVNPALNEEAIELLEKNLSYIDAVQQGFMKPHPYNNTYHLKPELDFKIPYIVESKYFNESTDLFNRRYNTLDF